MSGLFDFIFGKGGPQAGGTVAGPDGSSLQLAPTMAKPGLLDGLHNLMQTPQGKASAVAVSSALGGGGSGGGFGGGGGGGPASLAPNQANALDSLLQQRLQRLQSMRAQTGGGF